MSRLMLNSKKEKAFKTEGLSLVIRLDFEPFGFLPALSFCLLKTYVSLMKGSLCGCNTACVTRLTNSHVV